jgi:hypothetical protein
MTEMFRGKIGRIGDLPWQIAYSPSLDQKGAVIPSVSEEPLYHISEYPLQIFYSDNSNI